MDIPHKLLTLEYQNLYRVVQEMFTATIGKCLSQVIRFALKSMLEAWHVLS